MDMMTHKQEIFLQAYSPFHEALTKYCSALAYGKMDTEDLVQEVLLTTYEHFEGIRKKEQLLHYMIRAARNISVRNWRKNPHRPDLLDATYGRLKAKGVSPDQLMDIQILYAALQKLPESQREAVILFEITGLKVKEIAKIQGSSLAATKMRISRGRQQLRKLLKEKEDYKSLTLLSLPINPDFLPNLERLFLCVQNNPAEISLQQSQQLFVMGKVSPMIPFASEGVSLLTGNLVGSFSAFALVLCVAWIISSDQRENSHSIHSHLNSILPDIHAPIEPLSAKQASDSQDSEYTGEAPLSVIYPEERAEEGTLADPIMPIVIPEDSASLTHIQPPNPLKPLTQAISPPQIDSIESLMEPLGTDSQGTLLLGQDPCDRDWRFRGKTSSLKRKMLESLHRDKLIPAKQGKVRLKVYDKGSELGLLLYFPFKEKALPQEYLPKYKALFQEFEIPLCPTMFIESTPEYIAIGRKDGEGFHGRMTGKANISQIGE